MNLKNFQEIKTQLLIIGLAIFLSLGISSVLLIDYLNKIQRLENLDQTINTFTMELSELLQIQHKFLLEEPTNLYFYKTGNSIYLERFNQKYNNARQTINKLQALEITSDYAIENNFTQIANHVKDYHSTFLKLSEKIRERGNTQYGMIKKLENTFHILDSLYQEVPDTANISADLLVLQDFQQKFILNNSRKYYNRFERTANEYKENIQQDTVVNPLLKNKLLVTLENYSLQFKRLIRKENQLGTIDESGLQNRLDNQISQIQSSTGGVIRAIRKKNDEQIAEAKQTILTAVFILLGLLTIFISFIFISIARPLRRMKNYIDEMVLGKIPQVKLHKVDDEIGRMLATLNRFVEGLQNKTSFAKTIGQGDYYTAYTPISKHDQLGNALLDMQKNLQQAREEEQQHRERDQRNEWINNSLNDFNNLIKQTSQGISKLAFQIIAKLVDHVGGNQGGIFLYNETAKPPYLELIASYAYTKERKYEKKVMLQEGLVGSCAMEKKTIYLDEIPEDYSKIASGLGGSSPNYLLIIPLLNGDELLGVLEIASFYFIEEYKVEFLKRLSENIASTFSNIKINQQTNQLLDKTRKQSEELGAQEEEMRQNLEELQATQEESSKRQAEMRSIVDAVSASLLYIEFDMDGYITHVNDAFLKAFDLEKDNVIGKSQVQLEQPTGEQQEELNTLWKELKTGTTQKRDEKITINNHTAWLTRTYAPVLDDYDNPVKVISLAINNTETKQQYEDLKSQNEQLEAQEEEMRQSMEQIFQSNAELERTKEEESKAQQEAMDRAEKSKQLLHDIINYIPAKVHLKDGQGKILLVNQLFAEAFEKTPQELTGKTIYDLYDKEKAKRIEAEEQLIMRSSTKNYIEDETIEGQTYTYLTTKLPFKISTKGKIGILTISRDVSELKAMEQKAQEQKEMLQAQEQELKENFKALDKKNEQLKKEKTSLETVLNALDQNLSRAIFLPDGSIEEVNPLFAEKAGSNAKAMKGMYFRDAFQTADQSKVNDIWRYISKGNSYHSELEFLRPDGKKIWSLSTFIPIISDEGLIIRYYYFSDDITHLKELETELQAKSSEIEARERNMEEKINLLRNQKEKLEWKAGELKHLQDAVDESLLRCAFDEQFSITHINNNLREMLNYTEKQMQGMRFTELFVNPEKVKELENITHSSDPFYGELTLKRQDGSALKTLAAINAETGENGEITGYIFLALPR